MAFWLKFLLVAAVAAEHVGFLAMEMFLWMTPFVRKRFDPSEEHARITKSLAANMGLYNGFLAAGLFWSLAAPEAYAKPLAVFFLGCVIVAGLYGGYSVKASIAYVQAGPAVLALAAVLWL
jgi:putative membrane protein